MRLLALVGDDSGPDCLMQLECLHAVVEQSEDEIAAYLVSSSGPGLVPIEALMQHDRRGRLAGWVH